MTDHEAQLDRAIEEKRKLLAAYHDREERIAEAYTQRIEAACAADVARFQQQALIGAEQVTRSQFETAVLQLAFDQLKERMLRGEPLVSLPAPRRVLTARSYVPPSQQTITVHAAHPAAEALTAELTSAMESIKAELTKRAGETTSAMQEHVGQVLALTEAVNRTRDEFPAVFRYQGPSHD